MNSRTLGHKVWRLGDRRIGYLGVVAFLVSLSSSPANAQDSGASAMVIEEVVVTAQRRDQSMQDVPIAVSAMTGEGLEEKGILGTEALGEAVPGLVISTQGARFYPRLRGVGNSLISAGYESGVATYVDGVYYATTTAGIMSLSNIERLEVLKGPQGTLFGRNATGGLVHVITRTPEQEFSGNLSLGYANFDKVSADGYITGGLSDQVAMDLTFHYADQGEGWGENQFNGRDVYRVDEDIALRTSMLYTPSERTEIRFTADYSKFEGSLTANTPLQGQGFFHALPGVDTITDDFNVSLNNHPGSELEAYGLSAHISHEFDFAVLTSITAYRDTDALFVQEGDTTRIQTVDLFINQQDDQFSQELQLASNAESAFDWVVGLYYFDGSSEFDPFTQFFNPFIFPFVERTLESELTTEAYAVYGQATFALSDRTNLTAGVRYSSEERTIEANDVFFTATGAIFPPTSAVTPERDETFSETTYRVALDHRFTEDLMAYVSFNTGFKSGGYNGSTPSNPSFDPELLDAYEVGLKADLFEKRLRLNTAAFFYDYEDIQLSRFIPGATIFYNGPEAEIQGIDIEFEALLSENLTITGGASWLDTEFQSHDIVAVPVIFHVPNTVTGGNIVGPGDADGNDLPYAPDFTATLAAQLRVPLDEGELVANAQYSYNDGYFYGPENFYGEDSYGLLNASLTWRLNSGFEVSLWGNNLTDEYITHTVTYSVTTTAAVYKPPRTYGITGKYSF